MRHNVLGEERDETVRAMDVGVIGWPSMLVLLYPWKQCAFISAGSVLIVKSGDMHGEVTRGWSPF